jgi:GNAT superfamily N-acetyltransferase
MAEIVVRARRPTDFNALVDVDLASARHHAVIDPGEYRVPDRDEMAAFLARRLDDPDRQILVAEIDGQVVGAVDITLVRSPDPGSIRRPIPTADLGISVVEQWRGQGIGHLLMNAAEVNARARGAERMILDMSSANDGALRFYRGLGYRNHALVLRRSLRDEA